MRAAKYVLLVPGLLTVGAAAERSLLWRDPGAVEKLHFAAGPGGPGRAPKAPFRFLEEDRAGTSPKVKVADARGVQWKVKWGEEARAEVFASRLAWATGYFVEPTYFVRGGRIYGVTELDRAKPFVQADGTFTNARFEPRSREFLRHNDWTWTNNPFVGSRQLSGLKMIMMLTSNWDSKDARDVDYGSNTGIMRASSTGRSPLIYLVTDWGATMGKWGNFFVREKWDCEGYAEQTSDFIKGVDEHGFIKWGFHGKHTKEMTEGISVADARWLLRYLGRITDRQIRVGLEASGATPHEVECFSRSIRARINQLQAVASRISPQRAQSTQRKRLARKW